MKTKMVRKVPPWNNGKAKASPKKPPNGSTSAVTMATSSPWDVFWNCDSGKRSARASKV